MNVAVLLLTHPAIGPAVLASARAIVPESPLPVRCLEVPLDSDPERLGEQARTLCERLDEGAGVLVLTDLFGATPDNIARRLDPARVRVLSGLSLPMLLRLFNYPGADLAAACEIARSGALRGVGPCEEPPPCPKP